MLPGRIIKSVNENVTSIGLLLPKIIDDKVKVDTLDAKELGYISQLKEILLFI